MLSLEKVLLCHFVAGPLIAWGARRAARSGNPDAMFLYWLCVVTVAAGVFLVAVALLHR